MKMSLVIAFCSLMAIVAKAQEIPHEECPDSVTQEEQNYCVVRNYKVAEHALDSVYLYALNRISYHSYRGQIDTAFAVRKAFIQSQKSWLKYRQNASEVIGAFYEQGSDANAVAWTYKTKLTLDRIRELTFLANSKAHFVKPDWNWGVGEK